ncbi:MAG: PEP-CTERM sorting domain-containing protein [Deltaproteobacteria bacterium]|nr:PEP-CTERM sorting domain-containing protein [Deltaproteobacteria bacterium]
MYTNVYGDTAGVLDITLNIVPEPSTALLLMIGLGELSACNRRTRV